MTNGTDFIHTYMLPFIPMQHLSGAKGGITCLSFKSHLDRDVAVLAKGGSKRSREDSRAQVSGIAAAAVECDVEQEMGATWAEEALSRKLMLLRLLGLQSMRT